MTWELLTWSIVDTWITIAWWLLETWEELLNSNDQLWLFTFDWWATSVDWAIQFYKSLLLPFVPLVLRILWIIVVLFVLLVLANISSKKIKKKIQSKILQDYDKERYEEYKRQEEEYMKQNWILPPEDQVKDVLDEYPLEDEEN